MDTKLEHTDATIWSNHDRQLNEHQLDDSSFMISHVAGGRILGLRASSGHSYVLHWKHIDC